MHVSSLRIKNTKSLDFIELKLGQRSTVSESQPRLNVLFAANGQGKTTILESLSLLGHVCCMSRVEYRRGQKPQWTHQDARQSVLAQEVFEQRNISGKINLNQEVRNGLSAVLGELEKSSFKDLLNRGGRSWPLALSGFHFEVSVDFQGARKAIDFIIVCPADKSLSTLLSSEFTNCIDFQNYATVIYPYESRVEFTHWTKRMLAGRSVNTGTATEPNHLRLEPDGTAPFVSYINTDLSDFGRGNDLRESPKSLADQFIAQIIDRIGLPLTAEGQFRDFQRLRDALDKALYAPIQEVHNDHLIPINFSLRQLAVKDGGLNLEVQRGARRISSGISHISAGENECLFVYLLILAFGGRPGIILLDEPDLHLATLTKRNFFENLFEVADLANQQIIIATHSDAVIHTIFKNRWPREDIIRLIYTYAPDPSAPLENNATVAEYDPHFISALLRRRRRVPIGRSYFVALSVWLDRLRLKPVDLRSFAWTELSIGLTIVTAIPTILIWAASFFFDAQRSFELAALDRACKSSMSVESCAERRKSIHDEHDRRTKELPASGLGLSITAIVSGLLAAGVIINRRNRRKDFQTRFQNAVRALD